MAKTIPAFSSGDTIRFRVLFELAGTAIDPDGVVFRIKNPNKVVTSYTYLTDDELVKVSTGLFQIHLALSLPGEHAFRWEGTGTAAPGISEDRVRINRSMVLG